MYFFITRVPPPPISSHLFFSLCTEYDTRPTFVYESINTCLHKNLVFSNDGWIPLGYTQPNAHSSVSLTVVKKWSNIPYITHFNSCTVLQSDLENELFSYHTYLKSSTVFTSSGGTWLFLRVFPSLSKIKNKIKQLNYIALLLKFKSEFSYKLVIVHKSECRLIFLPLFM